MKKPFLNCFMCVLDLLPQLRASQQVFSGADTDLRYIKKKSSMGLYNHACYYCLRLVIYKGSEKTKPCFNQTLDISH